MGGMCAIRVGCPNYEATGRSRAEPSERLCVKGADGVRIADVHAQQARDRSEQARRLADEEAAMWARDFVRATGQKA
jgi:hypothetical protein